MVPPPPADGLRLTAKVSYAVSAPAPAPAPAFASLQVQPGQFFGWRLSVPQGEIHFRRQQQEQHRCERLYIIFMVASILLLRLERERERGGEQHRSGSPALSNIKLRLLNCLVKINSIK